MVDVMAAALDFYIQDKQEDRKSKRLVGTEHKSNHFSGSYIRDCHNILRRKAQVVRNVPIRQSLQLLKVVMSDENKASIRAEPWQISPEGASPYDASHQGESPEAAPALNPEGSQVRWYAKLLNKKMLREKKGVIKPKTLLENAFKVLQKKNERLSKT